MCGYMQRCMHVLVCTKLCVCVCVYPCVYGACAHMHVRMCICACVCIRVCVCVYACAVMNMSVFLCVLFIHECTVDADFFARMIFLLISRFMR